MNSGEQYILSFLYHLQIIQVWSQGRVKPFSVKGGFRATQDKKGSNGHMSSFKSIGRQKEGSNPWNPRLPGSASGLIAFVLNETSFIAFQKVRQSVTYRTIMFQQFSRRVDIYKLKTITVCICWRIVRHVLLWLSFEGCKDTVRGK